MAMLASQGAGGSSTAPLQCSSAPSPATSTASGFTLASQSLQSPAAPVNPSWSWSARGAFVQGVLELPLDGLSVVASSPLVDCELPSSSRFLPLVAAHANA